MKISNQILIQSKLEDTSDDPVNYHYAIGK